MAAQQRFAGACGADDDEHRLAALNGARQLAACFEMRTAAVEKSRVGRQGERRFEQTELLECSGHVSSDLMGRPFYFCFPGSRAPKNRGEQFALHARRPARAAISAFAATPALRWPQLHLCHDRHDKRVNPELTMRETTTRAVGIVVAVGYAALIGWLYLRQPQTMAQVTGGLSAVVGAYTIDEQAFAEALRFFRNDQFVEARLAFERADPAVRDARTQFYIAYSYYRQGWGRTYHDDALYAEGLAAVERALALAPGRRIVVDDPNLGMRTGEELKAELEAGIRRDASDFNPMRLLGTRK
jgi:hypothetical protein